MNTLEALVIICALVLLALSAIGIHELQRWLERFDYDRHFDD